MLGRRLHWNYAGTHPGEPFAVGDICAHFACMLPLLRLLRFCLLNNLRFACVLAILTLCECLIRFQKNRKRYIFICCIRRRLKLSCRLLFIPLTGQNWWRLHTVRLFWQYLCFLRVCSWEFSATFTVNKGLWNRGGTGSTPSVLTLSSCLMVWRMVAGSLLFAAWSFENNVVHTPTPPRLASCFWSAIHTNLRCSSSLSNERCLLRRNA